jgi:hypothetical protein
MGMIATNDGTCVWAESSEAGRTGPLTAEGRVRISSLEKPTGWRENAALVRVLLLRSRGVCRRCLPFHCAAEIDHPRNAA